MFPDYLQICPEKVISLDLMYICLIFVVFVKCSQGAHLVGVCVRACVRARACVCVCACIYIFFHLVRIR
jgi:hypothetical protein